MASRGQSRSVVVSRPTLAVMPRRQTVSVSDTLSLTLRQRERERERDRERPEQEHACKKTV